MASRTIAVVIYSMYGHIAKRMQYSSTSQNRSDNFFISVAEAVKAGIESNGGTAAIYQYVNHTHPDT